FKLLLDSALLNLGNCFSPKLTTNSANASGHFCQSICGKISDGLPAAKAKDELTSATKSHVPNSFGASFGSAKFAGKRK
ncbi:hypothetical protein, partial [Streptococcus pneumoniae]|uniref:hypothetical protein n=1 Tax=Streptococcus pneumoniae TaxID=1313 RepID=UPI0018B0C53A